MHVSKTFKNAFLFSEIRVQKGPDGKFCSPLDGASYDLARQYCRIAQKVHIVARVSEVADPSGYPVTGHGVDLIALPDYRGPRGLVHALPRLVSEILRIVRSPDGVLLLRLPEVISTLAAILCRLNGAKYFAFVVVSPSALIKTNFVGHSLLRSALRVALSKSVTRLTRALTVGAEGAVFVTANALQQEIGFPKSRAHLVRSNVVLTESAFRRRLQFGPRGDQLSVVSVSYISPGKGHELVTDALLLLQNKGHKVLWRVVGSGPHLDSIKRYVEKVGLQNVEFLGHVSDKAILRHLLDESDVLVHGSKVDGLSRAIIESMARSLPVVANEVGGNSEVIGSEFVCANHKAEDMSIRIERLLNSEELRAQAGFENYEMARTIYRQTDVDRLIKFMSNCFEDNAGPGQEQNVRSESLTW